ncbi:unnamed protein product [Diamesa tonsa]
MFSKWWAHFDGHFQIKIPFPRFISGDNDAISIQVSHRVTHQLVSRIYAIFLREILGYKNVILNTKSSAAKLNLSEVYKQLTNILNLHSSDSFWPNPTIDLEIWMLNDYHIMQERVIESGALNDDIARFGLYLPKSLISDELKDKRKTYPYTMFQTEDKDYHRIIDQYKIDDTLISYLMQHSNKSCVNLTACEDSGYFRPRHCISNSEPCATVLSSNFPDTSFIIEHINELKLKFNVYWMGDDLRETIKYLLKRSLNPKKKFLVLHWTPSEIIDGSIDEFMPIIMPSCEQYKHAKSGCKYEMTPMLKFFASQFGANAHALKSLRKFKFESLKPLIKLYEKRLNVLGNSSDIEDIYNDVSCSWLKSNELTYQKWIPEEDKVEVKRKVYIGGIFPITGAGNQYKSIIKATSMAQDAINNSPNPILPNHELIINRSDGKCKTDVVLKSFINYYMSQVDANYIGVLGPACSETVEPIAGISKHVKMMVISYSAEGVSFADRKQYPYFFRTIGENGQYKDVYSSLFKKFDWHRVTALTEDGQKHTGYISEMEQDLKKDNIALNNKKFSRELSKTANMNQYFLDLEKDRAKIIIADINDRIAQNVLCHAYKSQMTAKQGYVWFLPVYLSKEYIVLPYSSPTISCTAKEMQEALNGHLSLSHAPFGKDNDIMQENIPIKDWQDKYRLKLNVTKLPISDYGTYAYDAIWTYAYALSELIKNNSSHLSDLHSDETAEKLTEIIKATNFTGVSGKINFGAGGSRFTEINVLQWINNDYNLVGTFTPNISESKMLAGGELKLNESRIIWLQAGGGIPEDGIESCTFLSMSVSCTTISTIITTIACILIIVTLSAGSFWFWKRKYDIKLEASAGYMKNYGIFVNGGAKELEKWEIPKDRVVINRRIGEGAFGTVYGGEAQIKDNEGWTAVAVKTLKLGSTIEDRLDFLSESESMKKFEHKNIVKLLGVCLNAEPIQTIMEFMLYGDLKTFLLARRHLVNEKTEKTEDSDCNPKKLTLMALDVARGLSYLAEKKYVHRDVACRNCLVNAQKVVKLGDFGMARPMNESEYYRFNRKGMLPVRWMSPESLDQGLFTPASDVWSFGVLLYEIVTFGSFPFQGMTNNEVLDHVKSGKTVRIPQVKAHMEALMKACFTFEHEKRPSASEVVAFIASNPRIVAPCLDVPLASVQMPEKESDQIDLFSNIRRRSITPVLTGSASTSDFRQQLPSSVSTLDFLKNNHSHHNSTTPCYLEMRTTGNNHNNNNNNNNINYSNINGIYLNEFNSAIPDLTATLPNGGIYNPIEPLLQQQHNRRPEITKSNSSLMRYVPMCGFGNKTSNRSSSLERNSSTSVL